jgi:hypothetical protein
MRSKTRAVALAAGVVLLLAGGCAARVGEEASAPAVSGTAVPPTSAAAGGGKHGDGVSADDAKRHGEFAADFDARLVGPLRSSTGRAVYRLDNIGSQADTYRVVADAGSGATVTPSSVRLEPGASADLVVRLGSGTGLLHVHSTGRRAEVASSTLGPG